MEQSTGRHAPGIYARFRRLLKGHLAEAEAAPSDSLFLGRRVQIYLLTYFLHHLMLLRLSYYVRRPRALVVGLPIENAILID